MRMAGDTSGWGQPDNKPADEGLAEWGTPKQRRVTQAVERPQPGQPPPRRRWVRPLLWTAGGLLVALTILVALAPTIASSLAPGIVERSLSGQIAGSVKVSAVNVG